MLKHIADVTLPPHTSGGFDHADVHLKSGRVFIAHTANGTVEVVDGIGLRNLATIQGCHEASGVLCAQKEDLVFAAARGTGRVLVIEADSLTITHDFIAGTKPNGLAWDTKRGRLLVADVLDDTARLTNPSTGQILSSCKLKGRPRWCTYDESHDRYLVNIKDPSGVSILRAENLEESSFFPLSVEGAHGLELDREGHALVACDGRKVVKLDLNTGSEIAFVSIVGAPDVVWYNKRKKELYCAIGEPGVIEVIDTDSMNLKEEIKTEPDAHTLTFDQDRQRLYALLPRSRKVSVYEEA